jgi:protein-disulfide isomerase
VPAIQRHFVSLAGAILLFVAGGHVAARAQDCAAPRLTSKQKEGIVDYVRKKYQLAASIALTLRNEAFASGTCYRELSFQGKSDLRTWELTLYASPDLRFLTGELMDMQRDPVQEERAKNHALMRGLVEGAAAARGPAGAAVTIVEFSDFQCPFCGKFAGILDEALAGETRSVRVVFHHMPLGIHNWARAAAEGAACAQLQSAEAFWRIHDQLFRNQASLTPENIGQKLREFSKDAKGLDFQAFENCMDNGMSVGLVLKDISLADANQVNGTPTLFINGHRMLGIESAARLRELIAAAQEEGDSAPAAPAR